MNNNTYDRYLRETLKEETYNNLRSNIAKNNNNNLVNLDINNFLKELKRTFPNGYEAWEEDFKTLINKKKGRKN